MTQPDDEKPKRDPRKRPNNPFDDIFRGFGIEPAEFERMFEQMQRQLQDAMRNMGGFDPGKSYVHGFSFRVGPDGKPIIENFGNRPQNPVKGGGKPVFTDDREPLTEVVEESKQIAVTVEMPGVNKDDIDIRVTETELEITVDAEKRKYHKRVKMPAAVKPKTTKASYKNGILDVTIQKEAASGTGHRVKVD